jgi:hypothetical protein
MDHIGGYMFAAAVFFGGIGASVLALFALFPACRGDRSRTLVMAAPAFALGLLLTLSFGYACITDNDPNSSKGDWVAIWTALAGPSLATSLLAILVLRSRRKQYTVKQVLLSPVSFVAVIVFLVIFFVVYGPFISIRFEKSRGIAHIRRHQDPEELRAWASNLISLYSKSNYAAHYSGFEVTNRPPSGIPISDRFCGVWVQRYGYSANEYTDHVVIVCAGGASYWGMDIGNTNYVHKDYTTIEWKPGIYFLH